MPGIEVETGSPEETEALAGRLAQLLVAGEVVLVSGELGTGKTTFVRGACRALGVTAPVTSPTFTIGHRDAGNPRRSHLRLFRLARPRHPATPRSSPLARSRSAALPPAEWGDLEPYFDDAIVFVEWPEAGLAALPAPTVDVAIEHAGGDARILVARGAGPGL